jgi:hypothetical protein
MLEYKDDKGKSIVSSNGLKSTNKCVQHDMLVSSINDLIEKFDKMYIRYDDSFKEIKDLCYSTKLSIGEHLSYHAGSTANDTTTQSKRSTVMLWIGTLFAVFLAIGGLIWSASKSFSKSQEHISNQSTTIDQLSTEVRDLKNILRFDNILLNKDKDKSP